jgi:hypothetical protein
MLEVNVETEREKFTCHAVTAGRFRTLGYEEARFLHGQPCLIFSS